MDVSARTPSPTVPVPRPLRARWRELPAYARLLQRRMSSPSRISALRAADTTMWLVTLAVIHAGGRLLSHGTAVLSVRGSRVTWPQRTAQALILLLSMAGLALTWFTAFLLGGLIALLAGWPPGPFEAAAMVLVMSPFALTLARAIPRNDNALAAARARRTRKRQGGQWWEISHLAAAESDPVSAGRLVHDALAFADKAGIGAVAAARDVRLERAYQRLGFMPDRQHPSVLVRPPRHVANDE